MFDGWRKRLVADLEGQILEVGIGTGENLPHYRRATYVCGIEPDAKRAARARRASAKVPFTIEVARVESLPYGTAKFDHVVSSLVFCSVTDQSAALAEILRTLKPDGLLHMVEHVRPRTPVLAALFTSMTPWWSRVAYNCHLDRATIDVLREEGWSVTIQRQRAMFVRMSCVQPAVNIG